MKKVIILLVACLWFHSTPSRGTTKTVQIIASNGPLLYIAKRIGGTFVHVTPLSKSHSRTWEPGSTATSRMEKADLILLNGADFEPWYRNLNIDKAKLVKTAEVFRSQWLISDIHVIDRTHGQSTQSGYNPYVWLSPRFAKLQAIAIERAILKIVYDRSIERAAETLYLELDELDAQYRRLAQFSSRYKIMAAQTTFAYISQHYDLDFVNQYIDPLVPLNIDHKDLLAKILSPYKGSPIIWDKAPNEELQKFLEAKLQISSFTLDSGVQSKDLVQLLRSNLSELSKALGVHPQYTLSKRPEETR
ncbi:metal ABC transporter substrate-binding protein [Pseudobacteriovorax antillogorgiicola]|uniref:ABC-type Zn uptake system ZnuABC, Zn-binding component ZnuA n=1 Tax=Pseudobacteriovorax antillogorgiicola TaxID=1513793 RepID=A0A1Y6BZ21_9BACT|nr:zinc ABC transporter substrate-binding protein [Pseudobacteriovorax antillogorgiicola]TCS51234.1 ABC-type Zn uptake system ZnuABC Zn-binding protein ZnuA [Pseudobacteriovorax antillogorgiicola]SMF36836.1 ABC-type Zn uptake system ZnuABC, Zn-binding component ZnuA [Pseudobacteriovorax antillogorgiicola]